MTSSSRNDGCVGADAAGAENAGADEGASPDDLPLLRRRALRAACVGVWTASVLRSEVTLQADARCRTLLGDVPAGVLTLEEAVRHLAPGDQRQVRQVVGDALQGEAGPFSLQVRVAPGSETERWLHLRGAAEPADAEAGRQVVGVAMDVSTSFEAVQQALSLEQARLRAVLDQMPSGLAIAEAPSGQLLLHNEEAIRLLRHPLLASETVEGYTQYGALHEDGTPYDPEEYPIARAALHGEVVKQETMHYRRGDGTRTVFSVNAAPVRDAEGHIIFAVSTFHDISRRIEAEESVRRLPGRMVAAMEEERRHIARELHDELGGLLTALQMNLKMRPPTENGELREALGLVQTLLDRVRQIALALRPPVLDDLGVVASVRWLLGLLESTTPVTFSFYHELGAQERLPAAVETAAYRIIQEAVTNVVRHAEVEQAQVLIHCQWPWLTLHVIDEGAGFDLAAADASAASTGLSSMQERATLVGGHCEVRAEPGMGTRVTATLPYQPLPSS